MERNSIAKCYDKSRGNVFHLTTGTDAEPEPYFEPRARKAKLRCQAAQPVKYGYNYTDMNSLAAT